jgi:hypothetical protein
MEVKTTKIIKGHGLDKFLAESNLKTLEINHL